MTQVLGIILEGTATLRLESEFNESGLALQNTQEIKGA
jgi:hypothetical protein